MSCKTTISVARLPGRSYVIISHTFLGNCYAGKDNYMVAMKRFTKTVLGDHLLRISNKW